MKKKQYIKPLTHIYHVRIQPIANMMSGGGGDGGNGNAEIKSQTRIWDDDDEDDTDDYSL